MSDPRKNFICIKCRMIINDKYRIYGKDTECLNCKREKYLKENK